MSISTESSSYIELLLRDALIKENIKFREQYLLYEGGCFSDVKYVADFYLESESTSLVVECDGKEYHSGKANREKQLYRDIWLKNRGYTVLHFSYKQLKYKMPVVIDMIKDTLSDPNNAMQIVRLNTQHKKQKKTKLLTDVVLYCYYKHTQDMLFFVYKFKYNKLNVFSDEKIVICVNAPKEHTLESVLYYAMLDLKRPVSVLACIGFPSSSNELLIKEEIQSYISELPHGLSILHSYPLQLKYINVRPDSPAKWTEMYREVCKMRSRCTQIIKVSDKRCYAEEITYNDLLEKDMSFNCSNIH